MQQAYMEVLPKCAIGKALAYSIERWKQLMIYTTDGKLNIDNNPVERAIRPAWLPPSPGFPSSGGSRGGGGGGATSSSLG